MSLLIARGADRLDLNPGTSIGIEKNSPVYFGDRDPEFIPGQVTYTFAVPNTPQNRRILQRPAQLDTLDRMLTQNGWRIEHQGNLHSTGRLEVMSAGMEEDISITFIGGLGGNLTELKDNSLGSFFAGQEVTVGTEAQDVYNHAGDTLADPDAYNWLFPTINLAEDSGPEPESDDENAPLVPTRYAFLNLYDSGRYAKATGIQYSASSVVQPTIEQSSMAAQPRLHWVLKTLLSAVGFQLTGVFDSDQHAAELKNLLLVTNYTQDVRSGFASEEPTLDEMSLDPVIRPQRMMPSMKGADLLKKTANRFCWTPFIDEQSGRVRLLANRDLLQDPTFVDITDRVDPRYQNTRYDYNLPQAFTTEPPGDDSFAETFNYAVSPQARITEYETFAQLAASPLTTPNDLENVFYVVELNEYCFYRGGNANRRIYQSLGRDLGYINRDQEPVYNSGATTLLMRTGISRGTHRWLAGGVNWWWPAWFRDPVTPLFPDSEVTTECIFLFYRGLQPNGEGRNYPLASAGRYNFARQITGALSLLWNGSGGLYDVWWKEWISALHYLRPVTFRAYLSSGDIARLDMSRKYRIGQHLYFIRRVRTTLEEDGVGETTLDLLKIA